MSYMRFVKGETVKYDGKDTPAWAACIWHVNWRVPGTFGFPDRVESIERSDGSEYGVREHYPTATVTIVETDNIYTYITPKPGETKVMEAMKEFAAAYKTPITITEENNNERSI